MSLILNDVDKNILKTSDAPCLCEAGLTSINDKELSLAKFHCLSTNISYKNTPKNVVFSCDRPGDIKPVPN